MSGEERIRNGWKPHWGFACWYRGLTPHHSYGLPGAEREPLTRDEAVYLWGVPANGQAALDDDR